MIRALVLLGVQPSEIGNLTLDQLNALLCEDGSNLVTLADERALLRFLGNGY